MTVSREKAQELRDKGWVKETYFLYCPHGGSETRCYCVTECDREECDETKALPRATLDEVLGELSIDDFINYYTNVINVHPRRDICYFLNRERWLYSTMRSVDAAAEVWLKTRKESPCPA